MKYFSIIFWTTLVILGVIFSILNSHTISLHFYTSDVQIYLPLLLLIQCALGVLLGLLAVFPTWLRAKRANRKLKQKIKACEQEIQNLRTIPIKDHPSC